MGKGRGMREGDAKRRRRRRFLQGLHRFLNLLGRTRQLGGDGEGPREKGEEAGIVAALSEFVRLKIYPMCTVYQTLAVSIGARARVRVCPLALFPLATAFPLVYFLRARPLFLSLSLLPFFLSLFLAPRVNACPFSAPRCPFSCPFGAI